MAKKKKARGRPKKNLSEQQREKLAKKYQRKYYDENKEKISEQRSERWKKNKRLREAQAKRDQEARSIKRAEKHAEKLSQLKEASDAYWEEHGLQDPRLLKVGRKNILIYSTGHLAKHVFRSPQTIRRWISRRVIPGATVVNSAGWCWFDRPFMDCVFTAMSRTMLLDGRTPENILRQLVREELERAGRKVVWSPFNGKGKKEGRRKKKGPKKTKKRTSR